jgi:hypothetical protein
MNNNLLIIKDSDSFISDKIIHEANPTTPTIVQFSYYDKIFISRKYRNNVCMPRLPVLDDISFPLSYKLVSHVVSTNDLSTKILQNNNIDVFQIKVPVELSNEKLKLSNTYIQYYKFGAVVNFREDTIILEDLICLFYKASYTNDSLLVLCIESDDNTRVLSFIEKIHNQLNIDQSKTRIILMINSQITDIHRMQLINSIDCLLQLNTVFISDIEYYYAIASNKRIIGKYNLDNRYSIETVSSSKQLFKFNNASIFFDNYDQHDLYTLLKKRTQPIAQNMEVSSKTGISNIII